MIAAAISPYAMMTETSAASTASDIWFIMYATIMYGAVNIAIPGPDFCKLVSMDCSIEAVASCPMVFARSVVPSLIKLLSE